MVTTSARPAAMITEVAHPVAMMRALCPDIWPGRDAGGSFVARPAAGDTVPVAPRDNKFWPWGTQGHV
jgi:hypothetical protein